jgi:pyruvate dehydrogenase E1 component alpha subunit
MHIADFAKGMLGANGIVAGGISILTGAGLAAQLLGNGRVAVCFFGDGAANAGPFHESINIAAAWKLPVVYVCENNLYAAQTGQMATHAMPDVAGRAGGYGIPGVVVDGNDIFAVHEAASKAVARARAGEGPTLIECKTYRHRPHTERKGQPDHRPREEVALWMSDARDPIARLVAHLKRQQGQLTDDEWKEMDSEILARIERAVAFARASPFPRPEAATEDVFAAP